MVLLPPNMGSKRGCFLCAIALREALITLLAEQSDYCMKLRALSILINREYLLVTNTTGCMADKDV
jgi:hypothetical protein